MSDHVTTLTTDLLVHELNGVTSWQYLGMFLGLGMAEIKEIEQDHPDTPRRRMEMLEKWLRKEGNPSWEMVVEALEKMSEQRLANQLRLKYCTQQHQDEKPLTSKSEKQAVSQVAEMEEVLKEGREGALAQEIERLENNFLKLVTSTELAVEDTNPHARKIKRFSQFYMNDEATSVDELFDQMKPFYFLDYKILEKIVQFFLEQDQSVNSKLDEYIHQLNDFKSSTTVKQFMESIEAAQRPLNTAESSTKTTVVIQLVGGWLQKTIMDLDKLLKVLFQNKTSVLSHLRISPGSVIITYLTPLSDVNGLLMTALEQIPFMVQVGVCRLMIGDTVVTSTQSVASGFSFESSLIKAVMDNNIDVLHFLLDINTSPDASDGKGQTALLFGSSFEKSKAVDLLLKANANPNLHRDDGVTPLYIASQKGHADIVSLLLKASADPNLHTDDGVTPLLIATQIGRTDITCLLLKANANPNLHADNGVTPLLMASQNRHADIISLLLNAKANPNLSRDDGVTPLLIACQKGHTDIACLLLKANANPNLHADNGVTPLLMASQKGHTDITCLLLKTNANPNLHSDNGATPLLIAIQNAHADIISLLLKANANPNLSRDDGVTPLFIASQEGHALTVRFLLKANANPNLHRDDGVTPLMVACSFNHPEVVQLLLADEADPNLLDSNGISALMCACYGGCFESVELLLMYSADPSLQTPDGLTALALAAAYDHEDIVDLFHAVELSRSSSTSPVLTASEIATNVDNETLNVLSRAMKKMLVAKAGSFISVQSQKHKKILPSKYEPFVEFF